MPVNIHVCRSCRSIHVTNLIYILNCLFICQNNNRGGYNVGDKTNKKATKTTEQYNMVSSRIEDMIFAVKAVAMSGTIIDGMIFAVKAIAMSVSRIEGMIIAVKAIAMSDTIIDGPYDLCSQSNCNVS